MSILQNRVVFRDGDNLVIVIKNCTKQDAETLLAGLDRLAVEGSEWAQAEDAEVKPVVEVPEEIPAIPVDIPEISEEPRFESGLFAGKTVPEVLEAGKDKAFCKMSMMAKEPEFKYMEQAIRSELTVYLKGKMAPFKDDPYESISDWDKKACQYFLRYYSTFTLSDKAITRVCQQTGMKDFKTFIEKGTEENLKSLIATIIENLYK